MSSTDGLENNFDLHKNELRQHKDTGVTSHMNNFQNETKEMVGKVFNRFSPKLFMSIVWNDFPRDPITCISHSTHFKNVLLYNLYRVSKVEYLPKFPNRIGMMFFHERKEHVIGVRSVRVFHTHVHLYNDVNNILPYSRSHNVDMVRKKLNTHVYKLFKSEGKGLQGLDIREWKSEYHSHYNFKDLYEYRYDQDGDVVLDYENSDIPKFRNKTQSSKRTNDEFSYVLSKKSTYQEKNNQFVLR